MPLIKQSFTIEQGATFTTPKYRWSRQTGVDENGDPIVAPVLLDAFTGRMDIRARRDRTSERYHEMTSEPAGGVILGADGGEDEGTIQLWIPATVTVTFTWPAAFYDLELYQGTDPVVRFMGGKLKLSREVTFDPSEIEEGVGG